MAVLSAVGTFGEGLAVAFDFADVGFAFVGVGGDGEHDGVGRGGIENKGDDLAVGVAAGQGDGSGIRPWAKTGGLNGSSPAQLIGQRQTPV